MHESIRCHPPLTLIPLVDPISSTTTRIVAVSFPVELHIFFFLIFLAAVSKSPARRCQQQRRNKPLPLHSAHDRPLTRTLSRRSLTPYLRTTSHSPIAACTHSLESTRHETDTAAAEEAERNRKRNKSRHQFALLPPPPRRHFLLSAPLSARILSFLPLRSSICFTRAGRLAATHFITPILVIAFFFPSRLSPLISAISLIAVHLPSSSLVLSCILLRRSTRPTALSSIVKRSICSA